MLTFMVMQCSPPIQGKARSACTRNGGYNVQPPTLNYPYTLALPSILGLRNGADTIYRKVRAREEIEVGPW